jgi:hypothetical protein
MMTYELAKKLKDTGYPQPRKGDLDMPGGRAYTGIHNHTYYAGNTRWDNSWIHSPNLGELIEACGSQFTMLRRIPDTGWRAKYTDDSSQDTTEHITYIQSGHYPEEAVAKLWIKLHNE